MHWLGQDAGKGAVKIDSQVLACVTRQRHFLPQRRGALEEGQIIGQVGGGDGVGVPESTQVDSLGGQLGM